MVAPSLLLRGARPAPSTSGAPSVCGSSSPAMEGDAQDRVALRFALPLLKGRVFFSSARSTYSHPPPPPVPTRQRDITRSSWKRVHGKQANAMWFISPEDEAAHCVLFGRIRRVISTLRFPGAARGFLVLIYCRLVYPGWFLARTHRAVRYASTSPFLWH